MAEDAAPITSVPDIKEHDIEIPPEPKFDLPPIGEKAEVDNSEAQAALDALRKGEPLQGDESTE